MEVLTVPDLKLVLAGPPYSINDELLLGRIVDAVNAFITRVRPDLTEADGAVRWAAVELGKRWNDKRGSGYAASFGDLGYIPGSLDKDIEQLLGIGRYAGPVIA